MSNQQNQQGVGMIEVMVSLLLLAIAVLGFSAMQMVAVKTTDESMIRTRALTVIRGGSEAMRANLSAISTFKTELNDINTNNTTITNEMLANCMTYNDTLQTPPSPSIACTLEDLAKRDAQAVQKFAQDYEIQIAMDNCPGSNTSTSDRSTVVRQCFIASWGDTSPKFSDTVTATDKPCAKANGSYYPGATCFVMEAY